ncbi:CheR family methyltransferase [Salisediminibacterium halotolerans]|uniref:protein-glutamate O-methyltransferase n=1 Tax=Salisediminibacterium halotolerans TaxID=517425 RepID=A0A1H9P2M9_9BACI|nr:protein-glutamate O-methyltransferase CheR [Salisediminibacterium haloalkalitolerans]SER42450.1 chemotaxis protein methyltransferase CheR [Salisediminibacterium haloalkalitolerans]
MDEYKQFTDNIKRKTGIDLSLYKEAQMKRRLTSLRDKRSFASFHDYYQALTTNQDLFEEFLDRMTINVSEFFRNPQRWTVLETQIMPALLKNKQGTLNVWSAACSTGEEPYSLAMLLQEQAGNSRYEILATDLDESILNRAKKGFYPERSVENVSSDKLRNYFQSDSVGYRVRDKVKNSVRFKKHNLLADRFETGKDLIVCRNVMIYFTEEAKDDIYLRFSRALTIGGVLFVGSTEQIFNPQRYGLISEETFFYRKIEHV